MRHGETHSTGPLRGSAWLLVVSVIAALAAATLALSACDGGGDSADIGADARAGTAPGDLREVRRLPFGEYAFDERPASCTTTHAVLIVQGKPRPRELKVGSGACVIWGNKTDRDVEVVSVQPHPEGGRTTHHNRVPARSAASAYGPLERLTPARAATDEKRRREEKFCFSDAIGLGDPSTDTPVALSYTITPSGAKGKIIVDPPNGPAPKRPHRRSAPDLQKLRRLRCGGVLLEERPASCQVMRAVLIVGGEPRPSNVHLKASRSACLFWGNQDDTEVVAELGSASSRPRAGSRPGKRVAADNGAVIPPRTATELGGFDFRRGSARLTWHLSYTLQPSGAKATIAFE